jgi:hypothetical protein
MKHINKGYVAHTVKRPMHSAVFFIVEQAAYFYGNSV